MKVDGRAFCIVSLFAGLVLEVGAIEVKLKGDSRRFRKPKAAPEGPPKNGLVFKSPNPLVNGMTPGTCGFPGVSGLLGSSFNIPAEAGPIACGAYDCCSRWGWCGRSHDHCSFCFEPLSGPGSPCQIALDSTVVMQAEMDAKARGLKLPALNGKHPVHAVQNQWDLLATQDRRTGEYLPEPWDAGAEEWYANDHPELDAILGPYRVDMSRYTQPLVQWDPTHHGWDKIHVFPDPNNPGQFIRTPATAAKDTEIWSYYDTQPNPNIILKRDEDSTGPLVTADEIYIRSIFSSEVQDETNWDDVVKTPSVAWADLGLHALMGQNVTVELRKLPDAVLEKRNVYWNGPKGANLQNGISLKGGFSYLTSLFK